MSKSVIALAITLAAATGYATNSSLYRDLPLVSQVETGMSKEQVLQIGGHPLSGMHLSRTCHVTQST